LVRLYRYRAAAVPKMGRVRAVSPARCCGGASSSLVGGLMVALHAAARGIRLPRTTVNEVTIERNLRLEQTLARLRSTNLIGEDDARGRCVHERGADCGVGSREVQGRVDLKLLSPGTLRLRRQRKFGCGLAMGETGYRKFDHDAPQFQAERLGHRGLERLFTVTPLPPVYLVAVSFTTFAMSCALSS